MSKRIHFEDNIFYINVLIRTIRDGLLLDLDPGIFISRIMDDIDFVHKLLDHLLLELKQNDKLIERHEQLLNLAECEANFQAVLLKFNAVDTALTQACQPFKERFLDWQALSKNRMISLNSLTLNHIPADADSALVSAYELRELLKEGS